MPADPVHHTATVDTAWDGPAQEKKVKTPVTAAAKRLWAWHDPDGDQTTKAAHKFPHHQVDSAGTVGAANVKACTTIIGVLNGGMGGSAIPDKDRKAVYDHAAAHLKDAKVDDIPELKQACGSFERLTAANIAAIRDRMAGGDLQVRAELRQGMRNIRETRRCPGDFELREVMNGAGGNDLLFSGFASVTCRDHDDDSAAYEMEDWLGPWVESVVAGAFRKTLAEGCDVAFLTNHGGLTMARTKPGTLKLSEITMGVPIGLYTEARLDPKRPDVKMLRSAVERGDVDEMSFAFRVTRQEWNEDYDRRWITEVNLSQGDVSAVNYGANPHTAGTTAIRARDEDMDVRSYLTALIEIRAGKKFSAATLESINGAIDRLGNAEAVIEAREMLSTLVSDADPGQSGSSGNTQTESAKTMTEQLAEASLLVARNREAEKKRAA